MADQRSLSEQLDDLERMATAKGLYDAVDYLRRLRTDRACNHVWLSSSIRSAGAAAALNPVKGQPCIHCGQPYVPPVTRNLRAVPDGSSE